MPESGGKPGKWGVPEAMEECFQGEGGTAFQVSTEMRTVERRWPGGLEGGENVMDAEAP